VSGPAAHSVFARLAPQLPRLFRLAVLVLIAWTIRAHHERLRVAGDQPVQLAEARRFLPEAAALELETSGRQGWKVRDARGGYLGYLVRTQPQCRRVLGYCGVTDALIAFDPAWRVVGVAIRSSEDTIRHVEDVIQDRSFLKTWNGMSWEKVAGLNLQKAGIEGVSGATQTSMAIAESVTRRLAMAEEGRAAAPDWRMEARDWGLVCLLVMAAALCWSRLPGYPRLRRVFQGLVVAYLGFFSGDMLAQSLFVGWVRTGVNWRLAPGLTLLALAALAVPWATRRPLYCHHLCPYGVLQEWLGRLAPARWRLAIPNALDRALRRLPAALLAVVLVVAIWQLPLDPAGLEPFDAFVLKAAGGATLAVFVAGLVAACFLPQAYCHYGCPTGALLEYVRHRGAADRFGARDAAALALLALAWVCIWLHPLFLDWLGRR